MKSLSISHEELSSEIDLLNSALSGKPDMVPAGYKTVSQLANQWGLSYSHCSRRLREGVIAGIVSVKKFRVHNGQRGLYPVPHYRLNIK